MDKKQLLEELEREERTKDQEFVQKYNELCKEMQRELIPQMILMPGQHPIVQVMVNRIPEQN